MVNCKNVIGAAVVLAEWSEGHFTRSASLFDELTFSLLWNEIPEIAVGLARVYFKVTSLFFTNISDSDFISFPVRLSSSLLHSFFADSTRQQPTQSSQPLFLLPGRYLPVWTGLGHLLSSSHTHTQWSKAVKRRSQKTPCWTPPVGGGGHKVSPGSRVAIIGLDLEILC